jgi:hypothetical protein
MGLGVSEKDTEAPGIPSLLPTAVPPLAPLAMEQAMLSAGECLLTTTENTSQVVYWVGEASPRRFSTVTSSIHVPSSRDKARGHTPQ